MLNDSSKLKGSPKKQGLESNCENLNTIFQLRASSSVIPVSKTFVYVFYNRTISKYSKRPLLTVERTKHPLMAML